MKKLICMLLAMLVLGMGFAGCKSETPDATPTATSPSAFHNPTEPPVETEPVEMLNLPIPQGFSNSMGTPASEGYDLFYSAATMGITGKKISKTEVPETVTDLASFAAAQAANLGVEATQTDGFWTYSYIDETQNEPQVFVSVCYEGAENYWIVTIYSPDRVYEDNHAQMWGYIIAGNF